MDRDLLLLRDMGSTGTTKRSSPLVFPDMGHMELSLSPWHFMSRYRMSHESFRELVDELDPLLEEKDMGRPRFSKVTRILAALRYFGTETAKQKVQGDVMGLSQPTVSRIVPEIARAVASMSPKYIRWPTNETEVRSIMKGFYDIIPNRFMGGSQYKPVPSVIGCVDGTLIRILGRGIVNRENFRDRHGHISLNVMAVCDHQLRFMNVVNRWPGSTNDSRIFNESDLRAQFHAGVYKGILLGDKGYGIKPYLMTPFSNPVSQQEKRYNFSHCQVRNCIERAFGVLKRRWQILQGQINLELSVTLDVITACFVLHNKLMGQTRDDMGDELSLATSALPQTQVPVEDELSTLSFDVSPTEAAKGKAERDRIVTTFF